MREKAEEHAARARGVFSDPSAPVEPNVEAQLAIYELLLSLLLLEEAKLNGKLESTI